MTLNSPVLREPVKRAFRCIQKIATQENVGFIAASEVASSSTADREHLNEEGHKRLARKVEEWVENVA